MAGFEKKAEKKAGMDVKIFICQTKEFGFYPVGNLPRKSYEPRNVATRNMIVIHRVSWAGRGWELTVGQADAYVRLLCAVPKLHSSLMACDITA